MENKLYQLNFKVTSFKMFIQIVYEEIMQNT